MQAERWQQIKSLYEAVLKQPSQAHALLSGVDPQVRREVEALLASRVPDADATLTMANPAAPEQFGPYQVIAPIGKGGMGQVFKGLDTRLGRLVAIKTSQDRFNERFEREARAISSLNHPHICTLYDVGTTPSGAGYLVMELVEGETLAARLKRGKLTIEETLRCGAQIASALAAAHLKGIVHRDLKPANIMLAGDAAMHVKVLDFGLAKTAQDATLTAMNAVMGTPAYMAPEQAAGAEADAAADLFALGLVLYEMASGKLPLPGKSLGASLLTATTAAPRLSSTLPSAPKAFDALIATLLEKDPAKRPSSATVAAHLSALAARFHAPQTSAAETWRRPAVLIPVALVVLIAVLAGGWMYHQSQQQRWALEVAVPQIAKLRSANKPLEAYRLLLQAEEDLPGDPNIEKTAAASTQSISVTSSSPGATVEIQDYFAPDAAWYTLGTTPLAHLRIPKGYFRWRLSKPGADPFIAAPVTVDEMQFAFPPAVEAQPGMVSVPGGPWGDLIGFIGWIGFRLPAFEIDRYEVTNRDYQKFVDEGGYQKQMYWKEKFLKDGQQLTWQQAMDLFRDPTGRPGPSTWDGGHFPRGQENYPVSGVSWYEASAYAAYAGKSLPALGEWYKAAPGATAGFTTNQSNFSGKPLAVGASQAVGAFGTYDLTGNVREWCLNEVQGSERFILGGAWGTQTYQAYEPEALPPFDRSPLNGFRGVRNREPLPADAAGIIKRAPRDFSKVKPASDEVFQIYKSLYAYDKRALKPESAGVVRTTSDWTLEKVTIDAGYENERLPVYLFLPKNVAPPYQTAVFFPSARVNTMKSTDDLADLDFVDYVIKSGRAVAYPIYHETYGRYPRSALPGTLGDRDLTIQESKEVRRTVDYLETRKEVDAGKLAYLGVSQGSAYGLIFTALEDRFKAVVLLDGGFFLSPAVEGRDQPDFAPRLKKPVLMVNGKYDFTFPPDQSQAPMFAMIGTPPADKVRKVFETSHDVSQLKPALAKEVLAFLDKYLGRVN